MKLFENQSILIEKEINMRRIVVYLNIFLLISTFGACTASPTPVETVTKYLNSLVAKDAIALTKLSCSDWEQQSIQLLDSFTSVDIKLNDLSCTETENSGNNASVKCSGKIIATYNNENQELALSTTSFLLVKQSDEWLICGQK